MTTLEILKASRRRLTDPRKWRKYSEPFDHTQNDEDAVCAVIAMFAMFREGMNFSAVTSLFVRANSLPVLPLPVTAIYDWNDAPETTHFDVLAAFDRAIEMATKEAA